MKSMMWKSTLREIHQSMGRYLAILAIVALGVGFFAGIKETRPSMVKTADGYLKENNLYDFRLLSTLGFDDQIIALINERQDVRVVEGAYSFDILCRNASDGNEKVIKAHSITNGVNELRVLHGRMPQKANECVVDSGMYSHKYVGKKITLSDTNEAEDLDHFSYSEYKIVGIVESPIYIQFERGSSSLGNGKVSGFIYLLPEGFNSEAYTEVYVKLTKDFGLYDEAYDDYIAERKVQWEPFLEELGKQRFENIKIDGNEKLIDAKTELAKAEKENGQELADAKAELDKAYADIEEGKKQLVEAKEKLADGKVEIEKEEKKLDEAIAAITKNEKLLLDKEKELEDGIAQWEDSIKEFEDSKTQLEEGSQILDEKESQLIANEQQLAQKEAELIAGEEQLTDSEKLYKESLAAIEKREDELDEEENEWLDSIGMVPPNVQEDIDSERETLRRSREYLEAGKISIEEKRPQLAEGRKQIDSMKARLNTARQQLEVAKKQVEDGKTQLIQGNKELNEAWTDIKEGRKQIKEGRKELITARQEIEDGKRQLKEAKEELEDGERELIDKEQELADGEEEYKEGLKEYNEGLLKFEEEIAKAKRDINDAQEDLETLEAPEQYLLDRHTNVGYVMFQNDSDIVENISTVFPVFFFMVAALVCMTTMSRMIEEQRTQIGTLKALGYSKRKIMGKYIFYSGSAAVLGCIGGYVIGIILFPNVIWICYGLMYDLGNLHLSFNWKLAVVALVVSLICSVGTTWYSCRKELNEVSAQLMRPKTPQAGKRILLERISFIWNRLKFLQKVSIRNVFRYKKRFFMMVLGISGCAALVLAAFGIKDSIGDVMKMQYEEIQIYDMSVMLSQSPDDKQYKILEAGLKDYTEDYSLLFEAAMDIIVNEQEKSVTLVTCKDMELMNQYINMHTVKAESIATPLPGEAVITHKIAEKLGIRIGDEIELRDDEFNVLTVKISGIMQNFVANYLYIHPDTYTKQIGKMPEYKTVYMNTMAETDKHQLSADLMKLDTVTAVTINEVERERFEAMMSTLDYIVILVLVCAAALAFIVIYNLTNINITERIREIATIKVLGFYQNETATYVFRENIILALVGAFVGLGLGKVLHLFIMECIQIELVCFDVRIAPVSYLFSVLLTLFFAICVNKMMTGKLDRISMTESLKSVD